MKHTLYQLIILCLLATVSSCRVDELEGILDSSTAGSLSDPELQWDSDRHEVTFGEECDFPVLANCLILGLTWILESGRIIARTSTKLVTYDRIELIVPERREELVADLENRIGVKIKAVEIGSVDFLRDSAFIKVTYVLPYGESGSVDQLRKEKDYTG